LGLSSYEQGIGHSVAECRRVNMRDAKSLC
jgi:hypothetical protein